MIETLMLLLAAFAVAILATIFMAPEDYWR